MAVDTRNKRSSAVNISCPWRGMLPAPDGTIILADRQHVAFLYSGITAGGAADFGDSTPALNYYVRKKRLRRGKFFRLEQ